MGESQASSGPAILDCNCDRHPSQRDKVGWPCRGSSAEDSRREDSAGWIVKLPDIWLSLLHSESLSAGLYILFLQKTSFPREQLCETACLYQLNDHHKKDISIWGHLHNIPALSRGRRQGMR